MTLRSLACMCNETTLYPLRAFLEILKIGKKKYTLCLYSFSSLLEEVGTKGAKIQKKTYFKQAKLNYYRLNETIVSFKAIKTIEAC